MAKLYLVRHGSSVEQGMIRGRLPGYPLSEKGKGEAALAADWLADRNMTSIFTSPLQRAYETAEIIGKEKGIKPKLSEQLGEWYAPAWQGKYWNQISKLQLIRYALRPSTINLNGETLGEVAERMAVFIKNVSTHDGDIVCVSHRDPIIAGKLALMGRNLNGLNFERCKPGSVTVLDMSEEKARQLEYFEP